MLVLISNLFNNRVLLHVFDNILGFAMCRTWELRECFVSKDHDRNTFNIK
jgi:hypothetical protein